MHTTEQMKSDTQDLRVEHSILYHTIVASLLLSKLLLQEYYFLSAHPLSHEMRTATPKSSDHKVLFIRAHTSTHTHITTHNLALATLYTHSRTYTHVHMCMCTRTDSRAPMCLCTHTTCLFNLRYVDAV
jgi:hypothetical protein